MKGLRKMKKSIIWITIFMLLTVLTVGMTFTGCKTTGATETAVAAETTAAAETVAAAETTAAAVESIVAGSTALKAEYRFVQIPILVQSWFDQVFNNSVKAAEILGPALGTKITWELQSPQEADVVVQTQMFEAAVATKPDGIAIDCVDPQSQYPMLLSAFDNGMPVVQYISMSPTNSPIPYVSVDLYQDGVTVAMETIKRLDAKLGEGKPFKVAIIQGVPTNSAHALRYQATLDTFAKYPNITIVAEGIDNDDVENARVEASRILAANPDLNAFITCDAAGPVGAGLAIVEAKKIGEVILVGHDTLPALAQLMLDGVLDYSPYADIVNFGTWLTVTLMMQNLGLTPPAYIDCGFKAMTPENAASFLKM
jgi:ribose transport system substrate-binding protein